MPSNSDERNPSTNAIELAIIGGDLSKLAPEQRLEYYHRVCVSLGLNPLTKPFDYITLNGKLTLYARKDCTEQLRNNRKISLQITARDVVEGCFVVTARATTPDGRQDESVGAVAIDGLKGDARSNAMMKAETKAKRRVTLSICGLGVLDETEVESVQHQSTQVRQSSKPAIANGFQEPTNDDDPVRAAARDLEEADTLQELSGVWNRIKSSKVISQESKLELAKLKDERKVALAEPAAA